jgi:hypothetical protein
VAWCGFRRAARGRQLLRVAADEDEPEPGGGEAERDGAADAVGGVVAAAEGLAGAEEHGVDPRREADGGAEGHDEADGGQRYAGCARRNSTWTHVPAMAGVVGFGGELEE